MLRHQCQIQYSRYSIVFLFQSFCKSCIELCLVCKWTCGKMKRAKNRVLTSSRSSLKIKFIHSFLTSGSEGRQCKDCFFPKTGHCTVRGVLVSQFMTPYSTEVLQVWNIMRGVNDDRYFIFEWTITLRGTLYNLFHLKSTYKGFLHQRWIY